VQDISQPPAQKEGEFSPSKTCSDLQEPHTDPVSLGWGRERSCTLRLGTHREGFRCRSPKLAAPSPHPYCWAGVEAKPSSRRSQSCPVTTSLRPREQQEDLDLQSQSGHPCPAAANAPNLPEIPGICSLGRGEQPVSCPLCVGVPAWCEQQMGGLAGALPGPPAIACHSRAVAQRSHRTAPRAGGHGRWRIALCVSRLISVKVKARTSPLPPSLPLSCHSNSAVLAPVRKSALGAKAQPERFPQHLHGVPSRAGTPWDHPYRITEWFGLEGTL